MNSNRIISLESNQILPYYKDVFTVVKTNRGVLAFKLYIRKDIINRIINKYQVDREVFLTENSHVNKYHLRYGHSKSSYNFNFSENNTIINLYLHNGHNYLWKPVKNFTIYIPEYKNYIDSPTTLVCGQFYLEMDERLKDFIKSIVNEYNRNLKEKSNKLLQLKTEGF